MKIQPFRRFRFLVFLAVVLISQSGRSFGQTADSPGAASAEEAAKRLQWLKSVAPDVAPPPTPAFVKKRFAETRAPAIRFNDSPTIVTSLPDKPPAENAKAAAPSKAPRLAETQAPEPAPKPAHPAEAKTPAPHSATVASTNGATPGKPADSLPHDDSATGAKRIAESRTSDLHAAASPSPKPSQPPAHPENVASAKRTPEPRTGDLHAAASPSPKPGQPSARPENVASAKRTPEPRAGDLRAAASPSPKPGQPPTRPENVASAKRTPESRPGDLHAAASPSPKPSLPPGRWESVASAKLSLEPRITELHVTATPFPTFRLPSSRSEYVAGRYPWKTAIVTTIFWIGEPVSGNNFTPNCSSSWDTNWTQSYGGYDNPHPEARRNFTPVNFIPRQNPFYVALPYNDVTRGTTKPEARVVIPWFRESFRKEGQSVCRDRWVAVRNREGRVAYAQWSDCGPFRTDHWQYVFGMERPKPNLNQGAGLDVSPATRDYLGLQSTDVTDWKFVEARDVPIGPWSLYGDNNPFVQRRSRVNQAALSPSGSPAAEVAAIRARSW